jgi:hypothetical protein
MARVWDTPGLSPTLRLLLLALADHANDDGVCWPSYATLEARVGLSGRQLRRLLGEAEDGGHLSRRRGGRGPGDVTHYQLSLRGTPATPSRGTPATPSRGTPATPSKGDINGPKGDVGDQIRGTPTSLEPSVEPSIEPRGINAEPTNDVATALRRARDGIDWSRFPRPTGAGADGPGDRAVTG